MRILLANKFYYRRGGDCIYMLNLEQLLQSHGHNVAIFSMQYPENLPSSWSTYWPSEMSKLDVFTRPFGAIEVKQSFRKLLDDFKPELVHLNNIHTHLSPVIAKMAHECGIRVVWTLHDTKLVCPCYTCTRDGHWCEECFTNKKAVIHRRCLPGSLPGAVIGYYEMKRWNKERLQEYTDVFVAPSCFMMEAVVRGGYRSEKFKVLCNFIDVGKCKNLNFEKGKYYVYLGRVNEVKGIRTLCRAAAQLPYKLIVIGSGELLTELQTQYKEKSNIEFIGQKSWEEFRPILEGARFMVLPAEWSENNPLTVIESQSLGTPVLGARIGGIPELIEDGVSGMTFKSGDVEDLKDKIQKMMAAEFDYRRLAKDSQARYSSETYYEKLMEVYRG